MTKHRFTSVERYAVWQANAQECYYCHEPLRLKEVNVDHFIPERLLEAPAELKERLAELNLPPTFEINSYCNWLPIHNRCNLDKGGKAPARSMISMSILAGLEKSAAEAERIAKRVTSDRKADALIGKVLAALDGQTLRVDELLDALVGVKTLSGADQSVLVDELALELAIQVSKTRLRQIEERLLQVPHEIQNTYNARLDDYTGLVKLLPRGRYDGSMLVRGAGAYYSFANRTHAYGYGSDIELSNGQVSVGFAGCDFGFFVSLGEMTSADFLKLAESLRHGTSHSDFSPISTSMNYVPPVEEADFRKEYRRFSQGVDFNGVFASRRAEIATGKTFALRSIQVGKSDLVILFRVEDVRIDGSAVLLWSLAQTFPKPVLKRAPI